MSPSFSPLRSSRWLLLLLALLSLAAPSAADPPAALAARAPAVVAAGSAPPREQYDCRPFGECEPCPKSQRNEPFCRPYGNRRLLHCVPKGTAHHDLLSLGSPAAGTGGADGGRTSTLHEKEIPAWEACGKVVLKERQDYWEFVTTNVLFALVGTTVLLLRGRKLATLQYRQLAARIGLGGGGGTGDGAGGQRNRFFSFSL